MFDDDYIMLPETTEYVSADAAIGKVVERHKIPLKLSGGSGDTGWSAWRQLQQCPFLYYLKRVRGGVDIAEMPSGPRDVGSLVHAFLAIYYRRFKKYSVDRFIEAIAKVNVDPQAFMTARNVFDAYRVHYSDDYIEALTVEYTAKDPISGNTCRYDGIVRIDHPPEGVRKGIYICEHKTASRFSVDVLDGWALEGEILGELAFWKPSGCEKKFGKLRGVLINVLGKQRSPQFHRTFVTPVEAHMKFHLENLAWLKKLKLRCEKRQEWPQFMSNCVGRYGRCDAYDFCLNRGLE